MEQENKSSKKPVSFEFIGPSRAIQKKIQIGKKGAAVAAQEFPPTFDLEKLKEYRKKTGPAPKLFMPTDQDKEVTSRCVEPHGRIDEAGPTDGGVPL
mgnify:CR=1 FL=1